jgi:CheY-like chemotaxis protein
MYQRVLTFEGLGIEVAGNGQIGLETLRTFQPDIMLIDVMMPVMNGLELLGKVKADPATKAIPVIMLTNLADVQTAQDAVAKGALKYIVKSEYEPDQIVAMIKEVLDKEVAPAVNPASSTDETSK